MNHRLTIGFIDENAYDEYHNLIAKGMYMSALKYDMNIIRFGHFSDNTAARDPYHEEAVIDFIRQFSLDGLIFTGWSRVAANAGFRKLLGDIPMVSMGVSFEGIPGVIFNSSKYVGEMLMHLFEVHGFRRIAFIAPFSPDPRSGVYIDFMKAHHCYDPRLYVSEKELEGLSLPARGKRAVEILMDERRAEVEAIMSLYNDETYQAINALKARGVRIPEDIAVTSCEDSEVSRYSIPALTTIYFPWKEMGYYACEAIYRLLKKGRAPMRMEIPGRIIVRNSCGCTHQPAFTAKSGNMRPSRLCFEELGERKLAAISESLAEGTPFSVREVRDLLDKFSVSFQEESDEQFLREFELKLKKIEFYSDFEEFEHIAANFRKILMPYFLPYEGEKSGKIVWAENLFFRMQAILRNKISSVWFRENALYNYIKLILKNLGQIMNKHFNVENLLDSLEENLPEIGARGCYIYLFNNPGGARLFPDYRLEFEYTGGKRIKDGEAGEKNGTRSFSDVLFKEDRAHFLLAHLLHVGNDFSGFVLYDSELLDIRVYQILSLQISTALNAAMLLERLDAGYRKLMDQAHKKGMTDLTGTLHNIANIMNSVTAAALSLDNLLAGSPVKDLKMANAMLAEKLDVLDEFIKSDPKGMLLMQYYMSLGNAFEAFRSKLRGLIRRMAEKIRLIEEIIDAQQSYAGVKSNLEHINIVPVIDEALGMCRPPMEKLRIRVVRKHGKQVKVLAQRTKLFHVLTNIIKNAVESMENTEDERVLTIALSREANSVYLRISDTGPGIPEENFNNIFAFGFTTKKGGHGFGLHSCANYMAQMQGRIWAENVPGGKGAVFILQFNAPF
ncbi:MAG: substrate-binding domain-containing protein [Bacillota bacterium]